MSPDDFVAVARAGDVPRGKMLRVDVRGRRILLANVEGRVYAADDTCTHEDASLSRGCLRGEWVKCPLHGSRFNVCTGAVLDDPATEALRTYAVKVIDEQIWISVESAEPQQPLSGAEKPR